MCIQSIAPFQFRTLFYCPAIYFCFVLRFSIQFLPRAFVCCLYILFYNIFEWFVHLLYILFQCCWFSVVGNVADEEDLISRLCSLNIFFLMIWISLVQKEIDKLTVTFGVFVCIWLVAIESEINNILDPKYTINNHHDNSNNEFYFACDGSVRTAHVPRATYRWRFEGGIWPMAMADIIAPVAHIHLSA